MTRPVIDASAADLDLAMTEGDIIRFNWLVPGEGSWDSSTWICQIKNQKNAISPAIASLTVTVTDETGDADILLTSPVVEDLKEGTYYWDMQEVGGVTRFGGQFNVYGQVSE